jgi:hypothetical protein
MDTYPRKNHEQMTDEWLMVLKETQARFAYYKAIGNLLKTQDVALNMKMIEQMNAVVEATSQHFDGSYSIVSFLQDEKPLTGLVCGFVFDTDEGLIFMARQSQFHLPEPVPVEIVTRLQTPLPKHPAFG